METCRACLTTECLLYPLNEDIVYNYNILTNLDVKVSDEMFQYICGACYQSVKFFMNFREKCILTEASLKRINEQIKLEDIKQDIDNIKVESNGECNDAILDAADFTDDINFNIKDENCDDPDFKLEIKQRKTKRKYEKRTIKKCERKKKRLREKEEKVKLLSCGLCTREFPDNDKLTNHLEDHNAFKSCGICSQYFGDWPKILAHRIQHVPHNQKICHMCSKRFQTPERIEYHYRKHHFGQKDIMLSCNICNNTFDAPRNLRRHVLAQHSEKCFICDSCGKIFHNKHQLRVHIRNHAETKAYFCDLCKYTSKYSSGLKDHKIRRHSLKKVYCTNCKRPFEDQESLDKHKCRKRLNNICPVCGLAINESMRMSRHMETHADEGRYKCTRCPKVYRTRMAFRVHQNMHEGNRTYQCTYCPHKFYHPSALIKHRRIHTGEKPYVCKICKRGFTGNHNLKVHMKVHGENLIVKKVKPEDAGMNNLN